MSHFFNPTEMKQSRITQRFIYLKNCFNGSTAISTLIFGTLIVGKLIDPQGISITFIELFIYFIISLGCFFLILTLGFNWLLHWDMIVIDETGIKFRDLRKINRWDFAWKSINTLELIFEEKEYWDRRIHKIRYCLCFIIHVWQKKKKNTIRIICTHISPEISRENHGKERINLLNKFVLEKTRCITIDPIISLINEKKRKGFRYLWHINRD